MNLTPFGQDKFNDIHGLHMHYVDLGSPGLPALVPPHGFQSNAHTWDTFSCAVADTYRVFRPRSTGAWGHLMGCRWP